MVFNAEININDWLKYAKKNKVDKRIISFIEENNDYIYITPTGDEGEIQTASPRSWVNLSKVLSAADISRDDMFSISMTLVGRRAATSFEAFLNNSGETIDINFLEKVYDDNFIDDDDFSVDDYKEIEKFAKQFKKYLPSNVMKNEVVLRKQFMNGIIANADNIKSDKEKFLANIFTACVSVDIAIGALKEYKIMNSRNKEKMNCLDILLDKVLNDKLSDRIVL